MLIYIRNDVNGMKILGYNINWRKGEGLNLEKGKVNTVDGYWKMGLEMTVD